MLTPTPGQTIGPFYGFALPYAHGPDLVPGHHRDAVILAGTVYDGQGNPVPDSLVELWQATPDGQLPQAGASLSRDGHTFTGWGRAATNNAGAFQFTTLRPGAMGQEAPFWSVAVFARGLLDRLFTRAYLPDDATVLAADPTLAQLDEAGRNTLIATQIAPHRYQFDIWLQGAEDQETVFFRW